MGIIIDEFEVVLDSQQGIDAENSDAEAPTSAGNSLKPHDITAIFEQHELRCERVRAH
jgi:hypothetical protein